MLTKQLATIGIVTSLAVLVTSIIFGRTILLYFSSLFLIVSSASFILAQLDYLKFAIHLIIDGFLIGFTATPFCGLNFLSGILIYPLIIALAIFFMKDPLKRLVYALICTIGCIIFIYKIKMSLYDDMQFHLFAESLIIVGLLSALFIVGFNYFSIVFSYQNRLEENEVLLHNKNKELKNYIDSNLQLENFAHLASHELKTPLRNILNFSKLLSNKLGNEVSDQEKEMLSIIENQASEMDDLIKDLFELSSVTNEPMKAHKLELDLILSNLIKFDFFEHKSNIKVRSIPKEIFGNKSYIKEVFKNLISNALKFVSPDRDAQIEIDCQELKKEYQFSVKDNGIGIKKDKHDKVFLIFKRLHSRKEYEGTGIGLAICKKIVERHLGKIWIEDNPQGGTIFKFTIAKNLA